MAWWIVSLFLVVVWGLGHTVMAGFLWEKLQPSCPYSDLFIGACIFWPTTLPFMLAWGFGRHIHYKVWSYKDQLPSREE